MVQYTKDHKNIFPKPTINVKSSYQKEAFYPKVRLIMLADNYVCIVVLYLPTNTHVFTEVLANIQC